MPKSKYWINVSDKSGNHRSLVYIDKKGYSIVIDGPSVEFITLRHARAIAKKLRETHPTHTFIVRSMRTGPAK